MSMDQSEQNGKIRMRLGHSQMEVDFVYPISTPSKMLSNIKEMLGRGEGMTNSLSDQLTRNTGIYFRACDLHGEYQFGLFVPPTQTVQDTSGSKSTGESTDTQQG